MPLYEIKHSVPLTRDQRTELASRITKLHATTFTTPSFFVNVNFVDIDATVENYFVAGKPRPNGCNRLTGMVRTSEKRTKHDFDTHIEKLESIWNLVVRGIELPAEKTAENTNGEDRDKEKGKDKDKKKKQPEEKEREREAKRLHAVFLYPMVAARESGIVIPTAGEEAQWLKANMPEFESRAVHKGDEDMKALLQEIESREDLKTMLK